MDILVSQKVFNKFIHWLVNDKTPIGKERNKLIAKMLGTKVKVLLKSENIKIDDNGHLTKSEAL